jgi:hypothetical protein
MSLATTLDYQETGTLKSKKKNLMVISEMNSLKIIGFLSYRHRVGLLFMSNMALVSYIAWDKLIRFLVSPA